MLRLKFTLQPIDVAFAAEELVRHVVARSQGRVQDLCGPELLDEKQLMGYLARTRERR